MSRAASLIRPITAATVAGLLGLTAGAAAAAPQALGEEDLDRIRAGSAGGATPVNDPVPGTTERRDTVAVGNASLDTSLHTTVALSGDAQRGARALNLANVSGSDLVNLSNVLGADRGPAPAAFDAAQRNHVTQIEHVGASLGRWSSLGGIESRRVTASFFAGTQSHHASTDATVHRSMSHRTENHRISAQVAGFSPTRDWEVNLNLGQMPDIPLPDFGFDWTTGKEPFRYGVAAQFTGLELKGPALSLGKIGADGDDLVIRGGHITLPGLSLPDVEGELCAFKCATGTVRGTTVGNQTASLDVGDIRLRGANPLKDIDVQLGQGIAAVGTGTFDIQGIGAEVTASLEFQLPTLGGQSISFDINPSLDFMPDDARSAAEKVLPDVPRKTIDLPELELPSGSFEVTLIDFEAPVFADRFGFSGSVEDGVVCLSVASNECGEQSFFSQEVFGLSEERTTFFDETHSEQESFAETRETDRRPGAVIGEAEAGTLVLGRSEATVDDYSVVVISGNAQRDLRAMNLANATTASVASTANVFGTSRPGVGGVSAASGNVRQSNTFIQGFR